MPSILLINYNRPEKTAITIEPLKNCEQLFLFSDGPKTEGDQHKIDAVRSILNNIKQERDKKGLETQLLFAEKNLGTANGPITAITWFFNIVTQGHVIEDDILIHKSCIELQEKLLNELDPKKYLWIGCGHPLPNAPYAFLETQTTKLVAWSSWHNNIKEILEMRTFPTPWELNPIKLLKDLPTKTQIFLHKEFWRLAQNPSWSWYYLFLQFQLQLKKKGITPSARLHTNLGIDGSGHNCYNALGEKEEWDEKEIENLKEKPILGNHKASENKMEWERHGRIKQSLARIIAKISKKFTKV